MDKLMISTEKPKETVTLIEGAVASLVELPKYSEEELKRMIDCIEAGYTIAHQSAYRSIGMYIDSMASMYPQSEPLTMKERKKRYNDGLKKLFKQKY